jgi:hypothetical protein
LSLPTSRIKWRLTSRRDGQERERGGELVR